MAPASKRALRVVIDERAWDDATTGFVPRVREVAIAARRRLQRDGLAIADARPCDAEGRDGTSLAGCAKVYVPLGDGPPSERPFGIVVQLSRAEDDALVWVFVAFGPRHPGPGVKSEYERAHRRLHGHFPA